MEKIEAPKFWIGFDLGGTKMMGCVLDDKFKILSRVRKKTKGNQGSDAGVDRIVEVVLQTITEAGLTQAQIAGMGIGCPGPIDMDKGIMYSAPNLGWENLNIKKKLEDALGFKVSVLNDVDAGVYGEYRFGAGKDARCVVGLFPGTGIGSGCVYEGQIFRGRRISCMEVGHIRMVPDGPLSGSGHAGTLEAMSSRLAISAGAVQAAYRGQAPYLLKEAGTSLDQVRSGVLAESIKSGDKAVELIIKQAANHLGVAAATLIHILAPDVIILGGGLVEAMPNLFMDQITTSCRQWQLPAYKNVTEFKIAKLGDDAGVMGAAAWIAQQN
jgi:glucokinase